jgi:predicted dehydrogenase
MKIAIIGCGNIGLKRAKAIKKDKKTKIKIIVGRKKLKNKTDYVGLKTAKNLKCQYTSNKNDAIKSKVNSIILSTQPDLFLKIGKEILNSKKHLLIEKPLGLNSREALDLINTAKKNKVFLKTGFNLRFDDGVQLVKKIIDKKLLGKIYFFKVDYVNGSVKTNKNKIGALSDIGSHCINLFEYFISKKFKVINNSYQKNEYFKDDNGFLTIKSNKILGLIHYSFVRWKNKFFLEISGQKGSVTIESLPKWGRQTVTFSKRVYPSGEPKNKKWFFYNDNSWYNEWIYFKNLILKKDFKDISEGYITMKNIDLIKKFKK